MIGYTTEFMSMTRGYGIINHTFEEFRPRVKAQIGGRRNGALISMDQGQVESICDHQLRRSWCKLHGTRY